MMRPEGDIELAITFLYYRDLARAQAFYQDVMGFTPIIDQGWAKILLIGGRAHIGLVDETRGMHKWAGTRPVQICIRVRDVDAWHAYLADRRVANLSDPAQNAELGIRAFVFDDPEGYQVEVQSTTRPGA